MQPSIFAVAFYPYIYIFLNEASTTALIRLPKPITAKLRKRCASKVLIHMRIRTFRLLKKYVTKALVTMLLAGSLPGSFARSQDSVVSAVQNSAATSDVKLETPTGTLYGTLVLPAEKPPFPAVLIIAGSGMTDRDGNTEGQSGKSDNLKLLALGLAQDGIASLRYDKRGVARSSSARTTTNTFETQMDDAARWITWLGKDVRLKGIGIIGHSEGALVGTVAAQRGGASAIVLLAGGGHPMNEVIVEQMERAAATGKLSKDAVAAVRLALAELREGRTIRTRPKGLPEWLWSSLFVPRAQEYLISIFRYDPRTEVAKLPSSGVKVLVVHGTTDLMGGVEHAALLGTASGTQPVIIEGMNHELKSAPLDQKANDAASEDPRRPLAPGLIESIVAFFTKAIGTGVR